MKNDMDLFQVVANEAASEDVLRSCTELGFPA
jgi:branched-chain amino acid transport system substrate-binding protein